MKVTCALMAFVLACGCAEIGGFEEFRLCSERSPNCSASGGAAGSQDASLPGSGAAPGGDGSAQASTGGTGSQDTCSGTLRSIRGPTMAPVQRADGTCFWMDTTEVTVSQYAEFLAAPIEQPLADRCAWNVNDGGIEPAYAPDCGPSEGGTPSDAHPIRCVDWCDAVAFCRWAGKDLCGDEWSTARTTESDYYWACSAGDTRRYGCSREDCSHEDCHGLTWGSDEPTAAGILAECWVVAESGGKIHDLSGNVAEWTLACRTQGADGPCAARGGAYDSAASGLECQVRQEPFRFTRAPTIGFRCCAEATSSFEP